MQAKSLLVLLLLIIAGAAVYFVFDNDRHTQPVDSHQDDPAGTAAHGMAAPAPRAGTGEDAATAGALAGAESERTVVSVPDGQAPPSRVTVRGRLVDAAGAPRSGVAVDLFSWRSPDDLPVAMPAAARLQPDSARSAGDGRFFFQVERYRAGRLSLPGPEFVFTREPRFDARGEDVDLGDLEVVRASSIAGIVRDAAGLPAAEVKVVVQGDGAFLGRRGEAITDAAGRFSIGRLTAGSWHLRTLSSRYLPAHETVELRPEEQKSGIDLRLEQGKAIAGQVVDDLGVPVAGIQVGCKRREERAGATIERFAPDEATTTDSRGYFMLAGLEGAAVTVRAFGKGYRAAAQHEVPVGTGNLLLRVQRLGRITGTLRDRSGQPIAGSRVALADATRLSMAELDGALPFDSGTTMARTAADGSFALEGVPPGAVDIVATGDGHRPVRREGLQVLPAQTVAGVELVADRGATLRARVVDASGAPVAGARVDVDQIREPDAEGGSGFHPVREPGAGGGGKSRGVRVERDERGEVVFGHGPRRLGSGTTGVDGLVEIEGLPEGVAQASAAHHDHADSRAAVLTLPLSGVLEAEFVLRRPGFVELQTRGPDGVAVAANYAIFGPEGPDEGGRERTGQTTAGGAERIGPLAAGQYWAELRRLAQPSSLGGILVVAGEPEAAITGTRIAFTVAPGDTTRVTLHLPVLTRVHGVVTDAGTPAEGIELELEPVESRGSTPLELLRAKTLPDGSYAFAGIEAGTYRLSYGRSTQVVKATAEVLVPVGQPELRQDLALRFGRLQVRATDRATGQGIAAAEVELAVVTPGRQRTERRMVMVTATVGGDGETTTMTMGGPRARTNADGVAEIADVPPGTYRVRVRHDRYVAGHLDGQVVVEGSTTDSGTIQLGSAGRLRGAVLQSDGRRVPMALVLCRPVAGDGDEDRRPAMGGAFAFEGLAPGRYRLQAEPVAFGPEQPGGSGKSEPVEVEVRAGELTDGVELRLPSR